VNEGSVLEVRQDRGKVLRSCSRLAPAYESWAKLTESRARRRVLELAEVRDQDAVRGHGTSVARVGCSACVSSPSSFPGLPRISNTRQNPAYLFSASELIDRAADLMTESATLVHENERRWRMFGQRVRELREAAPTKVPADSASRTAEPVAPLAFSYAASRTFSTIRASLGGTNRAPATPRKARYGGLFCCCSASSGTTAGGLTGLLERAGDS
jgi:hypothetical protein